LKKPAEVSRFDSKERNLNKEKITQKLHRRHTRKSLPNPNLMKSYGRKHQPPPDLTRGTKNSIVLKAGRHQISTGSGQEGTKKPPPP
jgi:hypothetical protein